MFAVSCSIGIVFYPDGASPAKLIAHADAAMYAAKRAGGSTYCFFEPSMDADARDQVDLLRDLRHAIEQRQLELHYQPKIDAKSGQITAAEALLRWKHPTRGMIGPAVFIPIAERFGLIGQPGQLGYRRSLPASARMARQRPAHARGDEPVGAPDAPGRPGRAHPGRAEKTPHRPVAADLRDHGVGGDGRHAYDPGCLQGTRQRPASTCRSTTSAPVIRACRTCGSCPPRN